MLLSDRSLTCLCRHQDTYILHPCQLQEEWLRCWWPVIPPYCWPARPIRPGHRTTSRQPSPTFMQPQNSTRMRPSNRPWRSWTAGGAAARRSRQGGELLHPELTGTGSEEPDHGHQDGVATEMATGKSTGKGLRDLQSGTGWRRPPLAPIARSDEAQKLGEGLAPRHQERRGFLRPPLSSIVRRHRQVRTTGRR